MLRVVCWLWKPRRNYRSQFCARHVNVLRRMVARHYERAHEFVCITDCGQDLDDGIRVVRLWRDHAHLKNGLPHGPNCYPRLRAFSEEMREIIGPRFVSLDLDCTIVGNLEPLWDREEDFIINVGTAPRTPYNGSMWLMNAGSRAQVWEQFDPIHSPRAARRLGYVGSDQAWIAACLGPNERTWSRADGVYSFQSHLWNQTARLPQGSRIVFFQGAFNPWSGQVKEQYPWVKDHWQ